MEGFDHEYAERRKSGAGGNAKEQVGRVEEGDGLEGIQRGVMEEGEAENVFHECARAEGLIGGWGILEYLFVCEGSSEGIAVEPDESARSRMYAERTGKDVDQHPREKGYPNDLYPCETDGYLSDGVEIQEGRHDVKQVDMIKHRYLHRHANGYIYQYVEQAFNHCLHAIAYASFPLRPYARRGNRSVSPGLISMPKSLYPT